MISAIFLHTGRSNRSTHFASRRPFPISARHGFTLVEMLVAISITLVMMATVVGVFATVSSSVQNRRSAIEMGGQLRHVRNVLQRDLEGATCPTLPWTKPESNVGYFEIVEGLHADFYPSDLTDESIAGAPTNAATRTPGEIDHAASTLPSSNLPLPNGWVTDGGGLGDYDDILAFTSRNETEPFTGPAPLNNVNNNAQTAFGGWRSQTISSPVAEVVWFAVENPATDTAGYFGNESLAGFRTIYRRTLLVAPWLDYRYNVDGNGAKSRPGVLRVLMTLDDPVDDQAQALASLIAFQERYDISARIEFDPTIDGDGRWVIKANTLADLTDRKNRYEHHGFAGLPNAGSRNFPFVLMSAGGNTPSNTVQLQYDPELYSAQPTGTTVRTAHENNGVFGYAVNGDNRGSGHIVRPLAVLEGGATCRVIVNELGEVVYASTGLVPLGTSNVRPNNSTAPLANRRGQDLMLSDALAFDVQVFDPQAPVYALRPTGAPLRQGDSDTGNPQLDVTTVAPTSLGWAIAAADNNNPLIVSRGAYVDPGYHALFGEVNRRLTGSTGTPQPITAFAGLPHPKSQLLDARLTRVYDTWNFAYENDGINQDQATDGTPNLVDEGTNGFDDPSWYDDNQDGIFENGEIDTRLGVDDPGERETSPPYPHPLRAVQIKLRVYEADSRQMREVTVRQHFVPE